MTDEQKYQNLLPRDRRGFATGVLLILIGVLMLVSVWSYQVGTATRMGPGYWPRMVAYLLMAVGLLNCITAYFSRNRTEISLPPLRQTLLVPVGILLFSLTIEEFGFILSGVLLLSVSALASRESRLKETAALAACLIAFCSVLFVAVLGLSIRLLPMGVF